MEGTIVTFIAVTFEHTSLINLGRAFGEGKYSKKQLSAYMLIFTLYKMIIFAKVLNTFTFAKAIFNTCSDIIFLSLIFKRKTLINIFVGIFNYILNLVADYIVVITIVGLTGVTSVQLLSNFYATTIATFTSKGVLIITTYIFSLWYRQYSRHITEINTLEWLLMLMFPAVSFLTLTILIYTLLLQNAINTMLAIITVGIFAANAATIFMITKLSADKQIKQDNALLNQQLKMGMENIESLNSAYAQQRRLTHDFNNHLSVINSLLKAGNTAQAVEYTSDLLNTSVSVSRLFDSGNRIVDTLLTQKYNQAKEQNISMQVLLEDLSDVAMSADKLVVVLSNLLDNAIEAASKVTENRLVKVKFTQENGGHILTVQNTAVKAPAMENHRIISTKADKFSHGYGMKNIHSVLDSYGYPYTSSFDNGVYTFTAMLID